MARLSRTVTAAAGSANTAGRYGGVLLLVLCGSCATGGNDETSAEESAVVPIEQVLARVTERWIEVPGVEGTGIGLCDSVPCIKIFTSRPAAAFDPPIPEQQEGYRIRVEPTGPFRALDSVPTR